MSALGGKRTLAFHHSNHFIYRSNVKTGPAILFALGCLGLMVGIFSARPATLAP